MKKELSYEQIRMIEKIHQPIVICRSYTQDVEILAASEGFREMFGVAGDEKVYENIYKDVHPEDTPGLKNAALRFMAEGGLIQEIYRCRKKDGSGYRVIRLYGELLDIEDGTRVALLCLTDEGDYHEGNVTELNQAFSQSIRDKQVENTVRYDFLTGLPNLSYFFELAEIERRFVLDQDGLPALLYIDLSGMKFYNHKYGFAEGDKMLRRFTMLLSRTFGPERCCHVSADRFAAVAEEKGLEERLGRLFEEWQQICEDGHLPVRVGIYLNRTEDVPVGMAYDRAKIACDTLKGLYASSFKFFSSELNEGLENKQYILETLDEALSKNWIHVYYQPIMRAVNGKVCDEEALARWIDPVKGFLSPAEFIPYLEDAGLIYKLDLYVLENVLKHIRIKEEKGCYIVPHSINLSRSDFDACDMVEEIRQRVDAAGVPRDRISIEITESIIGSDFEFIKTQIERFQALGFPVWMDDFGSGYSSLDVLQSIRFDLLKFDMSFMRRLDENEDGRIILTELVKMALALGIDTICEGVETEDQARFLQEIGCSKLQGFYFSRPRSFEETMRYHMEQKFVGYENPEESAYYKLVCGVNLYDVDVIARDEQASIKNAYSTLPMCIIEVQGRKTRFVRSNQSYRDFFLRFFGLDLSRLGPEFVDTDAAFMNNVIKTCCDQGVRTFYDEKMPDGSIVHSFACRVGINSVTGTIAVAIAVLSIREPNEKLMIEQIMSVIETFGESMPGGLFIYRADENEELLYANKTVCSIFGCENLEEFKALTGFTFRGMVHPDDYEKISASIKQQVNKTHGELDFVEYRIIRKDGEIGWIDDYGHYIEYDDQNSLYYVFISDVTDKYEQAQSDKALHNAVIEALTKAYDSVWLITDLATERFELFRIDKEMEHLIPANVAVKIEKFSQALAFYSRLVLEEDRQRFLEELTLENIVRNTENKLIYSVSFRRVFDDGIRYYRLELTKLDLPDGKHCSVGGFKNVDEEVRKDQHFRNSLNQRSAVIRALGRVYDSIWLVTNLEKQHFELYRVSDNVAHLLPTREAEKFRRFTDALTFYSRLVHEEDRAFFLDAMTPENIRKNTERDMLYPVAYRRVFENEIRHYRAEVARLDLDNGEINYVVGFRDIDEECNG